MVPAAGINTPQTFINDHSLIIPYEILYPLLGGPWRTTNCPVT